MPASPDQDRHAGGWAGAGPEAAVRLAAAAALAWLAGTAIQLQQAALAPAAAYGAGGSLAVLLAAGGWLAWGRRGPGARGRAAAGIAAALLVAAAALAAWSATGWRATQRLADRLPDALAGRDLVVTGVVASLPRRSSVAERFEFAVEQARDPADGDRPVALPRRVSLSVYRPAAQDEGPAGGEAPAAGRWRAGERWRLTVRLRPPHGAMNPGGFDYELWLFERGIGATGYLREGPGAEPQALGPSAAYPVLRARQHLRDAIHERVADPRAAGVLAALVVGDQGGIDRDDWAVFRTTGVAHLVSISGLHLTMFAWLAAWALGWAWRRSPALMHACPAPQAARWGGLALATGYALLAGWGLPAQRTLGMLAVAVLLRSGGLRWPAAAVWGVAGLVVVVGDPWALLQPGFWLSFVAVGLLMLSDERGRDRPPAAAGRGARAMAALRSTLRSQLGVSIGLAPLAILFFQQVSLVGLLANLLAIPLVTLLLVPLALAGVLLPPLWGLAGWGVQGLVAALSWAAGAPWAVWSAPSPGPFVAAAALLGAALAIAPLPWRGRLAGAAMLLPLLLPPPLRPPPGRFELLALDVGQGTAVLLRTHAHLLVYDTGPAYSPEADAGDRLLLPLLRARGERPVDLLVLSHRDSDHVGGAASLLAGWPVKALTSSLAATHPLRRTGPPHRPCAAGQRWTWDGVRFQILQPAPGADLQGRANPLSCVLRVESADGASVLLTGDIESAQEGRLVIDDRDALRSQVLMVPHHGSRTSSSAAFLDAVAPEAAFVQAGWRSRFGHPAPDVLARYTVRGITVERSDRCGAWTWDGQGTGRCERLARRRYWHHLD